MVEPDNAASGPSIAETHAASRRRRRCSRWRRPTSSARGCACGSTRRASLRVHPRGEPRLGRRRLHRLRGRDADVRGALPGGRAPRDDPRRPLRRREGRPRRHRDAQLPRVVDRVLGRGRGRRDRRAAQRLVDGRRARLRPAGLGLEGRVRRRASAPSACATRLARARRSPHVAGRRAPTDRCRVASSAFETLLGDVPARRRAARRRASSPRTTRRSSTRRARPGSPRARSARTATSARNLSCASCSRTLGAAAAACRSRRADARRRRPRPAVGAALPRHRLPLDPRRQRSQLGGKLVLMYKWEPGARARADRARAHHDASAACPSMVWQVLESPEFGTRDTLERAVDRLRRRARRARARAPHQADLPRP